MWRCVFGLAILSGLAIGQEQPPGPPSKVNGYGMKAMENALRVPGPPGERDQSVASSLGLLPEQRSGPSPAPLIIQDAREGQNTCAIPLLTVHGDPRIDPRIIHKRNDLKLNGRQHLMSDMPVVKAMPVCK